MKKVNVMLSGILMCMSVGVFAQTTTDKLPATAQEFINQHFSSATVKTVQENSSWQLWEDEKYEVQFANGIEMDFDKKGNVLEIDSHSKEAIPMAALPSEIASYLKSNYPDAKIESWDKQDKKQEVELMDGTELEFDKNGSFVRID